MVQEKRGPGRPRKLQDQVIDQEQGNQQGNEE